MTDHFRGFLIGVYVVLVANLIDTVIMILWLNNQVLVITKMAFILLESLLFGILFFAAQSGRTSLFKVWRITQIVTILIIVYVSLALFGGGIYLLWLNSQDGKEGNPVMAIITAGESSVDIEKIGICSIASSVLLLGQTGIRLIVMRLVKAWM